MNSHSYIDLAAVVVSVIALLVSYFSYKETKRAHRIGTGFLINGAYSKFRGGVCITT